MSCPKCGSGNIGANPQCVDGLEIMCAAIADTTTLKTHLESVVKTSLSELIRNAKATKKANLFIHI